MVTLAGWLGICFLISIVLGSRPVLLVTLPILLRLSMPTYASSALVPGLHVAGYLTVVIFLTQAVFYWPRVKRTLNKSVYDIIGFALIASIMMLNTVSPYTPLGATVSNLLVVYVPPFALYLLIKMVVLRNGIKAVKFIAFAVLLQMIAQFIVAIQQDATGRRVVYEAYANNVGWWIKDATTGSSIGFVEGHLEFTAVCSAAIAITIMIKRPLIQLMFMAMIMYTAVMATGRASIAISIATAVLVVIMSRYSVLSKIVNLLAMALAGAAILFTTNAGERLLGKVEDDGASTDLRVEAYKWVFRNYESFIYMGYPGDRDFRSNGQLGSSLENAYLIQSVEYGLVFGVALLLLHISLALRNLKNVYGFVLAAGALGVVLAHNTHSGFSSNSVGGYLIWIMLGLSTIGASKNISGYLNNENELEKKEQ